MKKLIIAMATVSVLGTAVPARAASEIDCMVMWDKADVIRKSVKKYGMKTVDQLSAAEFMAACADDVFKISFYRA